jgi:hypothetical protein
LPLSGNIEAPNKNLTEQTERLDRCITRASESSDRLTRSLNRITLAAVIIATRGLLVGARSLWVEILKL